MLESNNDQIILEETNTLDEFMTMEEIENTMFRLATNKALGLDGYGAIFFKKAWSIVRGDIEATIKSFFKTSELLK